MTDLIQELRDGLEGTTAEMWQWKVQDTEVWLPVREGFIEEFISFGKEVRPLFAWMPDNIRLLLDRLEAAEKARDEARAALEAAQAEQGEPVAWAVADHLPKGTAMDSTFPCQPRQSGDFNVPLFARALAKEPANG